MKVKVFLPSGSDKSIMDMDHWVTIEEGTTLRELQRKLKLPVMYRILPLVSVNYRKVNSDYRLKEGDRINFYEMRVGG